MKTIAVSRFGSLGDVLLCTPALRELRRIEPDARIHFYTDMTDLVIGLPFIDYVGSPMEVPVHATWMKYEDDIPADKHLAQLMAESIGINLTDCRPSCVTSPDHIPTVFPREIGATPRIVIQRRAGKWTPNKNWPDQLWKELVLMLLPGALIIEVGLESTGLPINHPHYFDLRGISLKELAAAIHEADLLIAPDSGPLHLAAAVRTPAVVILGGYTSSANVAYPRNVVLERKLPCSPCWLRSPCPYDIRCLRDISPAQVAEAALQVLSRGKAPSKVRAQRRSSDGDAGPPQFAIVG